MIGQSSAGSIKTDSHSVIFNSGCAVQPGVATDSMKTTKIANNQTQLNQDKDSSGQLMITVR